MFANLPFQLRGHTAAPLKMCGINVDSKVQSVHYSSPEFHLLSESLFNTFALSLPWILFGVFIAGMASSCIRSFAFCPTPPLPPQHSTTPKWDLFFATVHSKEACFACTFFFFCFFWMRRAVSGGWRVREGMMISSGGSVFLEMLQLVGMLVFLVWLADSPINNLLTFHQGGVYHADIVPSFATQVCILMVLCVFQCLRTCLVRFHGQTSCPFYYHGSSTLQRGCPHCYDGRGKYTHTFSSLLAGHHVAVNGTHLHARHGPVAHVCHVQCPCHQQGKCTPSYELVVMQHHRRDMHVGLAIIFRSMTPISDH